MVLKRLGDTGNQDAAWGTASYIVVYRFFVAIFRGKRGFGRDINIELAVKSAAQLDSGNPSDARWSRGVDRVDQKV